MNPKPPMLSRLRIAGTLTGAGLLVQLATFFWNQASAFLVFALIGVPLVIVGSSVFLYSVVSGTAD
jgi:uncharacterized membrane protein